MMADPPSLSGSSLQIMSDLHLETPRFLPMYATFTVEPAARRLALLGDIGNLQDERLFDFLERTLQRFELVFYVLGNHEPYANGDAPESNTSTWEEACDRMSGFEKRIESQRQQNDPPTTGRFVFMDQRRFDVDDKTSILGCTLFSHITKEQESTTSFFVSDFSNISQWTTQSHNTAHARDLAWLNDQVSHISAHEPHRQIIILTHHSPTLQPEANSPDHLEDPKEIQSAFVTDLSGEVCWMSSMVKVWAFGHTHWNCDFVDRPTGKRVVTNQRGYGREDIFDFDSHKVISLNESIS